MIALSKSSRTVTGTILFLIVLIFVSSVIINEAEAAPKLRLTVPRQVLVGNPIQISGVFLTESGEGVPAFDVAIWIADDAENTANLEQLTTDSDGQFSWSFHPLIPKTGEYTVTATASSERVKVSFAYVAAITIPGYASSDDADETAGDTTVPDSGPVDSTGPAPTGPSGPSASGDQQPVSAPQQQAGSGLVNLDLAWFRSMATGTVPTVRVQPGQPAVLLPAAANMLIGEGRPLAVSDGRVTVLLPANSMAGLSGDPLQISINSAPAGQVAVGQGLSQAGSDVEVNALLNGSTGASAWSGKAQLTLGIDNTLFTNPARTAKLGIYRWQPEEGQWRYVGGWINQQTGTISVWLSGFSRYAVLESKKTFSDITSHWAQQDIEVMAARQVARGVAGEQFDPERIITRAEFTALLVRVLGLPAQGQPVLPFSDLKVNSWYHAEVAAAYLAGLVSGTSLAKFEPDVPITRQQLAVMLVRAALAAKINPDNTQVKATLSGFNDREVIAAWAQPEVAAAASLGLVKGTPEGNFLPVNNATRAEAVTMLRRFSDLVQQKD